jgi:hypothetical protein
MVFFISEGSPINTPLITMTEILTYTIIQLFKNFNFYTICHFKHIIVTHEQHLWNGYQISFFDKVSVFRKINIIAVKPIAI